MCYKKETEKMKKFFSKLLRKLFKRKHPYTPAAYIGRKKVQKMLDAKIVKRKKLEKMEDQEKSEQ
jgi:hypothetical protein